MDELSFTSVSRSSSSRSLSSLVNKDERTNKKVAQIGLYRRYKIISKWQALFRRWIRMHQFVDDLSKRIEDSDTTELQYQTAEQWGVCFDRILHNHHGKRVFLEFLSTEHAEENVYFWEAVEVFRNTENIEERKEFGLQIYKQFIGRNAPTPINFDSETKREVDINYTLFRTDLFDNMQKHIYTLMKRDKWVRFLKSPIYRMCLISAIPYSLVDKWKQDFNSLVATRLGKSLLGEFLDTQFARENLDFYDAVEEYRSKWESQRTKQRKRAAERIWKQFLDADSSTEVSIDSSTRERLMNELNEEEPSIDVFSEAVQHIHVLLENDCYPRFLRSSTFNNFLQEHQKVCSELRSNSA